MEEGLARTRIQEEGNRRTGADGVIRSRQQFVAIDPSILAHPKTKATISDVYISSRKAPASSIFTAVRTHRPMMMLTSVGHENGNRGRIEVENEESMDAGGLLAIGKFREGPRGSGTSEEGLPEEETTLETINPSILRRREAHWSSSDGRGSRRACRTMLSQPQVRSRKKAGGRDIGFGRRRSRAP